MTVVVAISLVVAGRGGAHVRLVVAAAGLLVAVSALTLRTWMNHRASGWCLRDARREQRGLVVQSAVTALSWYLLLMAAGSDADVGHRALIDCVMLGVMSAGASRYAGIPQASVAFVVTGIASICLYATVIGLPTNVFLLLCLYTTLLLRSVLSQARLLLEHQRTSAQLLDQAVAQERAKADAERRDHQRSRDALALRHEAAARRAAELAALSATFEGSVATLVQSLSQRAETGRDTAQRLGELTGRSLATVSRLLPQIRETSLGMGTVAGDAHELSASLGTLRRQVTDQSASALSVRGQVRANQGAAEVLNDRAGRISRIVGLIADIAANTNLLALNASIEAARAGDAARGFSIVAQEVKALAGQTQLAAQDIAAEVDGMRRSIADVTGGIAAIDGAFEAIPTMGTTLDQAVADQIRLASTMADRSAMTDGLRRALDAEAAAALADADAASGLSKGLIEAVADVARQSSTLLVATRDFTANLGELRVSLAG